MAQLRTNKVSSISHMAEIESAFDLSVVVHNIQLQSPEKMAGR